MTRTIQNIGDTIRPILGKYEVRYAGIFGSYARGDARPDSDVDILVSLGDRPFSVWDFVGFKEELSERLQKPVDLISDKAIVPYFRDYIYRDLKIIYGTR
ncbi:MAG: polymerase beta domain protein region protein [Parcubacteria group bacterium GW2011_GWA2_47_21]|nr:MAG: polymerase beta domain protein region protein [Parcubacteria group bacterium GW2011_GWA2_47_21]